MGDRANIQVKENEKDGGVFLYMHWAGSELPVDLQNALKKNWRWDDCQYLTRIIFDEMIGDRHGEEDGYGISAFLGDGGNRVLIVDVDTNTVSLKSQSWSFEDYCKLTQSELNELWSSQ